VEPVAPPGDRAAATAAGSGNDEERGRASGAPREERRSHRGKALAMEEPTPATSESQTPTVAAPAEPAPATSESQTPTVAAPAEPPMPQHRRGNVAIEVRPKLGNAVQSFEIVKVAASVDGYEVSALDGKSFGPHRSEVEAWNGTIDAGEHVLNVVVEYHGNGHGVFSYFDGYRYTARSSTHFRLDEGARLQMMVDLIDKGGVNTAFDKRLAIAFAAKP
jgi:hypothetical protein